MKKILIFTLIFALLFALTGCSSRRTVLDNGQTVEAETNFYIIKTLYSGPGYDVRLCYDPETKVMYYMTGHSDSYSFGVSPYYLSNGVVGIYGVNYK